MKLTHLSGDVPDKEDVIAHVLERIVHDARRHQQTGWVGHNSGGWRVRRRDDAYFGGGFGSKPNWANPYVGLTMVPGAGISAEGRFGYPSLSIRVGTATDLDDPHVRAHLEEIIEHELFVHGRQQPTAAVRSRHLPKHMWKKYAPFRLIDRTYHGLLAYYTRPTEIEAWVTGMVRYARLRQLPLEQVLRDRLAAIKAACTADLEPVELTDLLTKVHEDWLIYASEIGALSSP